MESMVSARAALLQRRSLIREEPLAIFEALEIRLKTKRKREKRALEFCVAEAEREHMHPTKWRFPDNVG
jgi:hypothetical protein